MYRDDSMSIIFSLSWKYITIMKLMNCLKPSMIGWLFFEWWLFFVPGWKFGAVFSRSGAFPSDCVRPIAPPDFLALPLDRTTEPQGGAGQFAVSSAVAVAVASTMAAYEIDQTIEVEVHSQAEFHCSVFLKDSLGFRGLPSMASAMASWMRGCCRTPDMTWLSLLRSTSDTGPKEAGKTSKNTRTGNIYRGITLHCVSENSRHGTYECKLKDYLFTTHSLRNYKSASVESAVVHLEQ